MEWVVKLEAKSGWGELETIEVARLEKRGVGLSLSLFGTNGSGGGPNAGGRKGAHRVATVRAAVLDGRLYAMADLPPAA